MRIVYSWLKEFLPEAPGPERLEVLLAGLGLEVERIMPLAVPHRQVVFARVLAVEPLEGREVRRLVLDAGQEVQVVSGDPNAQPGMGVALALPGAVLPEGSVGVRRVAGVESYGMVLSARELGLGEYGGGLLEFPPEALPPGTPLAEVFGPDEVIEVEITPNRPDWLSVYGVARDLATLGFHLIEPRPQPKTTPLPLPFGLTIEEPRACDRFTLSYARGIRIGPSPLQVQRRLFAAGMRPISNVVDATNYAMLELGNPMHAYDAAFVGEGLWVRFARPGERLVTLDGVERTLGAGDLLIAVKTGEETRPAGLAGVMGGAEDEIRATTTAVALEVAHFDPVTIRRTARRHGLRTEASYRFERGVDPEGVHRAADRFFELLQAWGGEGVEVAQARLDLDHTQPPEPIAFRPAYTNRLVGMDYPEAEQLGVLARLGCRVEAGEAEGVYRVTPPSHRVDLRIEEDLVEEVARIVGYDKIPTSLPSFFPHPDNLGVDEPYEATERLKAVLAGLGFQEVINYAWSSPEECALYRAPAPTVYMQNPQTPERTALRTMLYPGLLKNLQHALAQGEVGPFLLFEVGRVFQQTETLHLAGLLWGEAVPGLWQRGLEGSFFALKGLLETAARNLGSGVRVERETAPHLHPGISGGVYWNGVRVGQMGALHPAIAEAVELPLGVFLFELALPLPKGPGGFRDMARFPASLRDLAVVVPEEVPYAEVERLIRAHAGEYLERLEVFDLYRGRPLEAGQKSLAFHLVFRHPERTLTDLETEAFMQQIIAAVESRGYAIRR
ncbi:phenylalanine--tRNA ligase subunit beta [Meiothermus sp. QL-1]|uniref:phenylalanine--tRNA ligase subunit beta n=1 Tax=Meiothermus sp. QL-1 TaxID=2058095 RepID=UPI000E0AE70C|nr:phenylalanine--tRNA ligase subunit beta [Meiothermus sp. QL-1]RDI96644.1 phenylalanine--tRNA ligase subunit beta [Meiothermus sp. QL-1]